MSPTWGRFALWLGCAAGLYVLVNIFDLDEVQTPRRPLPESEGAWIISEPAPVPFGTPVDEAKFEFEVSTDHELGEDVIGTAFAVAPGVWVTARHVVDDCRVAYVRVWGQWRRMQGFASHDGADVAILKSATTDAPPALGITDRLPVLDQDGFHFGFPQGHPAAVRSKFIGLARLNRAKRRGGPEMGWVWAELGRDTGQTGPLGGISGGPQVDRTGAVQGVTVAYADRTGRVITTPVARVREVVPEAVPHVAAGQADINQQDYGLEGEHARTAGSVALVFCSAEGNTRPRR